MKTRYYALPAIFGLIASLLLPFQPPATLSDQAPDTVVSQSATAVSSSTSSSLVTVTAAPSSSEGFSIASTLTQFRVTDGANVIPGSSIDVFLVEGQNESYVDGFEQPASGTIDFDLNDGVYYASVRPETVGNAPFARGVFDIVVDGASVTVTERGGAEVLPSGGIFDLVSPTSNLQGRILDSNGQPFVFENGAYIFIDLEKFDDDRFQFAGDYAFPNSEGYFNFKIDTLGTYRVKVFLTGFDDYANTNSSSFVVSDLSSLQSISTITPQAPDARFFLRTADGTTNLTAGELEVRFSDGEQLGWFSPSSSGQINIAFPAPGTYRIITEVARDGSTPNSARKSYDVSVTGTVGNFTVTVAGVTAESNGSFILRHGAPTLMGTVYNPDKTAVIRFNNVVPSGADGREMWDLSVNTDVLGQYAITLPEGTHFLTARAPWGQSEFGSSSRIGPIVVNSAGVATSVPAGMSATAFDITLRYPTWTGTVVEPGTTNVMTNVQVCFVPSRDSFEWICGDTDENGVWSITAPDNMTAFDENAELVISEFRNRQFAERRYTGAAELTSVLGAFSAGGRYGGIVVSPAVANLRIEVTLPDGTTPASNVWVGLDRQDEGWLGGSQTNGQGIASVSVNNPLDGFSVQVNIEHNAALNGTYAPVRKTFAANAPGIVGPDANGVFTVELSLEIPNFRGTVVSPGNSPEGQRNVWVEAFNTSIDRWVGGVVTDADGDFSMNLEAPVSGTYVYDLILNPPHNSAEFARKTYRVTVDSAGDVTDVEFGPIGGATDVTAVSEVYTMALNSPSVRGVVTNPSNQTVRDSWVTPLQQLANGYTEYLWQLGANSNRDGAFSMGLEDGDYLLEANVPWNNSGGLSRSARCAITVDQGVVTTQSGCVDNNGNVNLELRAPNLTFTLVDGNQQPVANAHVGVGLGDWFGWSQSNRNGEVSIFIDEPEIAAMNPSFTTGSTHKLRFWVDPPWGRSDIVRWECEATDQAPLCDDVPLLTMGTDFPTTSVFADVEFPEPNTTVTVRYPTVAGADNSNAPVGEGAWVGLFLERSDQCTGCREWLAGSNTNSAGVAAFNIPATVKDASSSRFAIEVNAPWGERGEYSPVFIGGLTFDQLNLQSFALATPNLGLTVLQPGGISAARWSWVGLEELNESDGFIGWISGSSVDRQGKTSLTLPANKRLKLLFFPGGGSEGVITECIVTTDANGIPTEVQNKCDAGGFTAATGDQITQLVLTLSAGNVTGVVTGVATGTPTVPGAVVYAEKYVGGVVVETQQTVTDSEGKYGLNLSPLASTGDKWVIKVFSVGRPGDARTWVSRTETAIDGSTDDDAILIPHTTDLNNSQTVNITLAEEV
jgi:hypothetical protein